MKKMILIKGKPFYYEDEAQKLKFGEGSQITKEQAKDILFSMKHLLDSKQIRFWLIYGTLLGAIRENDFIPYDFDVDIQTDELDKLIEAIPFLDANGIKLIRVRPYTYYTFSKGGVYIDVYIKRKAPFPFSMWCYWLNGNIVPQKYLRTFREYDFLGERFLIPEDSEGLLSFFYGTDWRTPKPGVHGQYDIFPIYLYRRYLKKWIGR